MLELNDLTQEQLEYFKTHIYNGVGSREFLINPPDLIFDAPALEHDFAYWRGGQDSHRKTADKKFLIDSLAVSRTQSRLKQPLYVAVSYVYYAFLAVLGRFAFEYYDAPAQTWGELLEHYTSYQASRTKKVVKGCMKLMCKVTARIAEKNGGGV